MAETRINAGHTNRDEEKAEEAKLTAQAFTKTIIYELKGFQRRKTQCCIQEKQQVGKCQQA